MSCGCVDDDLFENLILIDCSTVSYSGQVSSEWWKWQWQWLFYDQYRDDAAKLTNVRIARSE